MAEKKVTPKSMSFGPRRGSYIEIADELGKFSFSEEEIKHYEDFDLIYRTLCGILYNFVPTSGHPGGSISSGLSLIHI